MAIKKSELYSTLWASCDELRGGMDASQYKDYVLVMLFVKYISDKYAGVKYAPIEVPKGSSFMDMVALKGNSNIGELINTKIIQPIAEKNKLTGTIDLADFDNKDKLGDGKEMVDRLSKLIALFENPALDFSKNRAGGDDILGDAYEYLMQHFASDSGKSKGQFYTPAEVSRVMAKIIGVNNSSTNAQTTVYDPTCGSGSLLLKVADEAGKKITPYGQEMDTATAGLARMNMVLHDYATAVHDIRHGNTLANPVFTNGDDNLQQFDFVVANPPFSAKSWTNGVKIADDKYKRFQEFATPPEKNGDYAFLLHIVKSLKSRGKGAIILPHGVLFRGNTEAEIRKKLILKGYIKGIIGLAPNLFYGTGIPACIIVLDKENAVNRKSIFMIDAGKDFIKDGNKNRLREQDIHKIVDVFNKQLEIKGFSKIVKFSEIEKNDFNLNIPRYIDNQEQEDVQDIEAHLLGDIPNRDVESLQNYWEVYPNLRKALFTNSNRKQYSKLKVKPEQIKQTIFSHPEFIQFSKSVANLVTKWKTKNTTWLLALDKNCKPKEVIHRLSEDLLNAFTNKPLINKYDVYQHLMSYWGNIMQDDVYIISGDGWKAETYYLTNAKGKITNEWTCDLLPKNLVTKKYFAKEQQAIDKLETYKESIQQQLQELEEEHSGDDSLLSEAKNDKGIINKASLQKRLKEIKGHKPYKAEQTEIEKWLALYEKDSDANKNIALAKVQLDAQLLEKYEVLKPNEIKQLVVFDKWMATLEEHIHTELERINQKLTNRIIELSKRYQHTLNSISQDVKNYEKLVSKHLQKMGF